MRMYKLYSIGQYRINYTVCIISAKDAKVTTLDKPLVSIFGALWQDVSLRHFLDGIIENFRYREKN